MTSLQEGSDVDREGQRSDGGGVEKEATCLVGMRQIPQGTTMRSSKLDILKDLLTGTTLTPIGQAVFCPLSLNTQCVRNTAVHIAVPLISLCFA